MKQDLFRRYRDPILTSWPLSGTQRDFLWRIPRDRRSASSTSYARNVDEAERRSGGKSTITIKLLCSLRVSLKFVSLKFTIELIHFIRFYSKFQLSPAFSSKPATVSVDQWRHHSPTQVNYSVNRSINDAANRRIVTQSFQKKATTVPDCKVAFSLRPSTARCGRRQPLRAVDGSRPQWNVCKRGGRSQRSSIEGVLLPSTACAMLDFKDRFSAFAHVRSQSTAVDGTNVDGRSENAT